MWRAEDPQGNEAAKVRWEIVPFTRGDGLDLGCGPHKAFPHFVGVDNRKDTALFGIEMAPDLVVETCERLDDVKDASLDFIFSSHLLEHIEDYGGALKDWWRCIKPGGHLVLYLPHKDLYPNIGTPGANPDHKHDFLPEDITKAMQAIGGFDLLVSSPRSEDAEYSFLQVYRKREDARCRFPYLTATRPKKSVCVVRYGGFGDMLQACNIFPALKRQGYHVTVMTTPRGMDVIKHDPNVDDWFIQDPDQVPNHCLPEFWAAQAKHFDEFINLSESVEGTLLAMPGRANHGWRDDIRRKYLGKNYLEFTAELAGLPYTSEAQFYPSSEERAGAQERQPADRFNILFALAGSSVHKFYPGQDNVIALALLNIPEVQVTLVGDEACKILEAGWENEPRVVCRSGELGIRDTLALAQTADVVVGPETGVLNAVAFEGNAKVCLLSHSSVENLTKHWLNAVAIEPKAPCYPCHRLHYSRQFCPEDDSTGAALCSASIDPHEVFAPVWDAYQQWQERHKEAA